MIMDGHGGVGSVTMETRGREEPRVYASYQSIISGILRVVLVPISATLEILPITDLEGKMFFRLGSVWKYVIIGFALMVIEPHTFYYFFVI